MGYPIDWRRRVIQLGPFELTRRIGVGAMSDVWHATHVAQGGAASTVPGTPVAVKIVTARDGPNPKFRRMFGQEVRSIARLRHPGIVQLHDYGELPEAFDTLPAGAPYCVMEWISGGSLRDVRTGMPWPRLRKTLLALLDALAHAHARSVVHRDLKPDNVLSAPRGPVLTDFGVAARMDRDQTADASMLVGTPNYMAPEQIRGDWRALGPWTDLYALGCLGWYLVTGEAPFAGRRQLAILRGHIKEAPPALKALHPMPPDLEGWLRRLLSKAPQDRFMRAATAGRALQGIDDPGGAASSGLPFELSMEDPPLWTMFGAPAAEALTGELHIDQLRDPILSPMPMTWRYRAPLPTPRILPGAGRALFGLREIGLVGREGERDAAWDLLRRVWEGDGPRLLLIEGPAGRGKTQLAEWLTRRGHELGALRSARATHEESATSNCGLGPMLLRLFRCADMPGDEQVARVARALGVDPEADVARALVAAMAPSRELVDGGGRLILGAEIERYQAICDGLSKLSSSLPLVLHFDDAHWGPDALSFIEFLLSSSVSEQVLVVATVQGDVREGSEARALLTRLQAAPRVSRMVLGPLGRAAMQAFVQAHLPLAPDAMADLIERAEGEPVFVEEALRRWVRGDALVDSPEGFRARPISPALPDRLDTVWADRLAEVLDPASEAAPAFEAAAVLGQIVDEAVWSAVCRRALLPIDPVLFERLQDAGLVRVEDVSRWSFTHPQLADTLRAQARDDGRWASLNAVCADVLSERPDVGAEQVAAHLDAAGEGEAAVERLGAAAEAYLIKSDFVAATRALTARTRILRRLRTPRSAAPWVLTRVLWAAQLAGRAQFKRANRWAVQAVGQARALGDDRLLALALLQEGETSRRIHGAKAGWTAYWEAVRVVRSVGDPVLEARVRLKAASCQSQLGHLTEARRMLDAALAMLGRRHPHVRAEALYGMAVVGWQSGQLERTLAYAQQALHHYQRAGTRSGMAAATGMLGDVARHQGELDTAEAHFRECLRLLEATGAAGHHIAVSNLAMVLLDKGALTEAHGLLEDALERSEAGAHATASALIRLGLLVCDAKLNDWSRWSTHFGGMQLLLDGTLTTADVAYDARRVARLARAAGQRTCADALWSLTVEQFRALGREVEAEDARAEWIEGGAK